MTQTKEERFDFSYYLMLLHCNQDNEFGLLKRMFSTLSSTNDPLDYHMIWHQRALLKAVGAFSANDLYVLDMGLVSQLLSGPMSLGHLCSPSHALSRGLSISTGHCNS